MICIIALIVFGILGLFSATYRKIAKEALDCVFRRITFRKCTTGLDKRLKSAITGKIMTKSLRTARFVYKYFEVFSWFFLILMIVSMFGIGYGIYNYVLFGNCNGPQSNSFCVINKIADTIHSNNEICTSDGNIKQTKLTVPDISNITKAFIGNKDADITIIEFGCYSCHYTRQAQTIVEEVINEYKYKIRFIFLHFPIESHRYSTEASQASICAEQQGKFWEYHEELFKRDLSPEAFTNIAKELNLDMNEFNKCMIDSSNNQLSTEVALGKSSGVYATPTFFVNQKSLVGLQTKSQLTKLIEEELK
ncbi:MAG: thioredoxin domain-containing protein [Candidatus Woesearchaeota archaeon]